MSVAIPAFPLPELNAAQACGAGGRSPSEEYGRTVSSEVRLWVLGATSHMGNNNRWAREGGVIDELLVGNIYRNPEGNPVIFDSVLLEYIAREQNIQLLLNIAVDEVAPQASAGESRIAATDGWARAAGWLRWRQHCK